MKGRLYYLFMCPSRTFYSNFEIVCLCEGKAFPSPIFRVCKPPNLARLPFSVAFTGFLNLESIMV